MFQSPLQCLYHRRSVDGYTRKYVYLNCRVKLAAARHWLDLSTLLHHVLLGKDLPQQNNLPALPNLGTQRLQPVQQAQTVDAWLAFGLQSRFAAFLVEFALNITFPHQIPKLRLLPVRPVLVTWKGGRMAAKSSMAVPPCSDQIPSCGCRGSGLNSFRAPRSCDSLRRSEWRTVHVCRQQALRSIAS